VLHHPRALAFPHYCFLQYLNPYWALIGHQVRYDAILFEVIRLTSDLLPSSLLRAPEIYTYNTQQNLRGFFAEGARPNFFNDCVPMVAKGEPRTHNVTVGFEYSQPSSLQCLRARRRGEPSSPLQRRGTIACLATIHHGNDPFRQLTEVILTRCALHESFSV